MLSRAHCGCQNRCTAPAKGSRWDCMSPVRTRNIFPPCPCSREKVFGEDAPNSPALPLSLGTRRRWPAKATPSKCTASVGACDNRQHISQQRGASFPACHGKHKQPAGTQQGASVSLRAEPVSHSLLKSAGRKRRRRRKDAQGTPHLQADALLDWRERRSQREDFSP